MCLQSWHTMLKCAIIYDMQWGEVNKGFTLANQQALCSTGRLSQSGSWRAPGGRHLQSNLSLHVQCTQVYIHLHPYVNIHAHIPHHINTYKGKKLPKNSQCSYQLALHQFIASHSTHTVKAADLVGVQPMNLDV